MLFSSHSVGWNLTVSHSSQDEEINPSLGFTE
jgi:hypothetical protein